MPKRKLKKKQHEKIEEMDYCSPVKRSIMFESNALLPARPLGVNGLTTSAPKLKQTTHSQIKQEDIETDCEDVNSTNIQNIKVPVEPLQPKLKKTEELTNNNIKVSSKHCIIPRVKAETIDSGYKVFEETSNANTASTISTSFGKKNLTSVKSYPPVSSESKETLKYLSLNLDFMFGDITETIYHLNSKFPSSNDFKSFYPITNSHLVSTVNFNHNHKVNSFPSPKSPSLVSNLPETPNQRTVPFSQDSTSKSPVNTHLSPKSQFSQNLPITPPARTRSVPFSPDNDISHLFNKSNQQVNQTLQHLPTVNNVINQTRLSIVEHSAYDVQQIIESFKLLPEKKRQLDETTSASHIKRSKKTASSSNTTLPFDTQHIAIPSKPASCLNTSKEYLQRYEYPRDPRLRKSMPSNNTTSMQSVEAQPVNRGLAITSQQSSEITTNLEKQSSLSRRCSDSSVENFSVYPAQGIANQGPDTTATNSSTTISKTVTASLHSSSQNSTILTMQSPPSMRDSFSDVTKGSVYPAQETENKRMINQGLSTSAKNLTSAVSKGATPSLQSSSRNLTSISKRNQSNRWGSITEVANFSIYPAQEVIFHIIEWDTKWLPIMVEINEEDGYPPILGKRLNSGINNAISSVKDIYISEDEYSKTYFGLHLLSIWCDIYKSWKSDPKKYQCYFESFKEKNKYFKNTCNQIVDTKDMPIKQSIILVTYTMVDGQQHCMFGYVYDVMARSYIPPRQDVKKFDPPLKDVLFSFYTHEKIQSTKKGIVFIQKLCRVRVPLKQYEALIFGTSSDMKNVVLNPAGHVHKIRAIHLPPNSHFSLRMLEPFIDSIAKSAMSSDTLFTLVEKTQSSDSWLLIFALIRRFLERFPVIICVKDVERFHKIAKAIQIIDIDYSVLAVKENEIDVAEDLQKCTLRARASKLTTTLEKAELDVLKKSMVILTVLSNMFLGESKTLKPNTILIIDDSHLASEAETALALDLLPRSVVLLGISTGRPEMHSSLRRLNYNNTLFHRLFKNAK